MKSILMRTTKLCVIAFSLVIGTMFSASVALACSSDDDCSFDEACGDIGNGYDECYYVGGSDQCSSDGDCSFDEACGDIGNGYQECYYVGTPDQCSSDGDCNPDEACGDIGNGYQECYYVGGGGGEEETDSCGGCDPGWECQNNGFEDACMPVSVDCGGQTCGAGQVCSSGPSGDICAGDFCNYSNHFYYDVNEGDIVTFQGVSGGVMGVYNGDMETLEGEIREANFTSSNSLDCEVNNQAGSADQFSYACLYGETSGTQQFAFASEGTGGKIFVCDNTGGSSATIAATCGDGNIDANEQCDGSDFGGAFCNDPDNGPEPGFLLCDNFCRFDETMCDCGDGNLQPGESCDNDSGTRTGGDGCSEYCEVEAGYVCSGSGPASCSAIPNQPSSEIPGVGSNTDLPPTGTTMQVVYSHNDNLATTVQFKLLEGTITNCETDSGDTTGTVSGDNTASGTATFTPDALNPESSYTWCAQAYDGTNYSLWAGPFTFTTGPESVENIVKGELTDARTDGQATLRTRDYDRLVGQLDYLDIVADENYNEPITHDNPDADNIVNAFSQALRSAQRSATTVAILASATEKMLGYPDGYFDGMTSRAIRDVLTDWRLDQIF